MQLLTHSNKYYNNEICFIPLYFAAISVRFWHTEYVAANSQVHVYCERAPSQTFGQI